MAQRKYATKGNLQSIVEAIGGMVGGVASLLTSHADDSTRHITSSERATWNGKADATNATQSANGLMSSTDKAKLDGIADNATANIAYASNPVMDGVASVGSSDAYSRGDHRHPTDTSRAPIESPEFTGTPEVPTAALGTDTTQVASTAFVHQEMEDSSKTNSPRHLCLYIDQDGDLCQE